MNRIHRAVLSIREDVKNLFRLEYNRIECQATNMSLFVRLNLYIGIIELNIEF